MIRSPLLILIGLGAVASNLLGQQNLTVRLHDTKEFPVPGSVAILEPIRCDSAGNLFYREFLPPGKEMPLLRLELKDGHSTYFDISGSTEPKLSGLQVMAFAVGSSGEVYELARGQASQVVLIQFDAKGKLGSIQELDRRFEPVDLAVFTHGETIISGIRMSGGNEPSFAPFLALFDRNGRFVKNVTADFWTLPSGGSSANGSLQVQSSRDQVPGTIIESDGNYVYVLEQGQKPSVLLVSPSGTIERKIDLPTPEGAVAESLRVGPGGFLIEYVRSHQGKNDVVSFARYDAADGVLMTSFDLAPDVIATFGCYDWKDRFSFVSLSERGNRTLVTGVSR